jgi:hypothetical protein
VAVKISRFAGFAELNRYRRKLLQLGMVGVDASGIGFGNLSIRNGATLRFYITGSATGRISELTPADCAKVVDYDLARNWLQWEGSTVASSESLTHAAVYESDPTARAVIHCHDVKLWAALLDKVPTTPKKVEYGTAEMAYAVQRLFDTTNVKKRKIFVMAGHAGGLVAFGTALQEAFRVLMDPDAHRGRSDAREQHGGSRAKKCFHVFLILLIGVSSAWANLGDNVDKIEDSYGQLVERHLLDDGTVSILYHKDRYFYLVIVDKGVSVLERFSRVDRTDLSEKEIAKFLKTNAASATWRRHDTPQERRYERSDHKAEATYLNVDGRPTLTVRALPARTQKQS